MSVHEFYSKWLHDGKCLPQAAACLIHGKDPDECSMHQGETVYEGYDEYAYTIMHEKPLQDTVDILCSGSEKWWNYSNKNIFAHINTALKNNNIAVVQELLVEIKKFYSNYLPHDTAEFNKLYPYLVRELGNVPSTETEGEITTEAKYDFWRQTALRVYSDNPSLKKKELAKAVFIELKQKNPNYLKTIDGTEHDPSAIERKFRMCDIKKQLVLPSK